MTEHITPVPSTPRIGGKEGALLEYVAALRVQQERSPGLSASPFSAEALRMIEAALRTSFVSESAFSIDADTRKRAEETLLLAKDPTADAMSFWRARAGYLAEQILRAPQSASRWISVHERLPEGNADVIVWGHARLVGTRGASWVRELYREAKDMQDDCEISFWQPLPEAPHG